MNEILLTPSESGAPRCPYALCETVQDAVNQGGVCSCEAGQTLVACASCSTLNRIGAHFCRSCRAYLEAPSVARIEGKAPPADFLALRGCFRRPPLLANGQLYALDTAGKLLSIAPRKGARMREVARLRWSQAGFNRGAIVEPSNTPGGLRGYLYLAASPSGLEAVSLTTGRVFQLYEPQKNERIVANSSEQDALGFKGVAATPDFCAIPLRTEADEIVLTCVSYSAERPVEQPLKIAGREVCGPVRSGRFIVLCSDETVGVLDIDSGRAFTAPLPDNFRPMMNRETRGIRVSPGSTPLAAIAGDSGLEAWVAGYEVEKKRGRESIQPGLLQVSLERGGYSFHEFADGGEFYTQGLPDGRFFVATPAGIQFPGQPQEPLRPDFMKLGMPVSFADERMAYFRTNTESGWHQVEIRSEDTNAQAFFQDARNECDEDSCCEVLIDGKDVVVPFLRLSSDPAADGLKFAHWRFS